MDAILELKNIVKEYSIGEEKQVILNHIDFKLRKGEFVSILGPSGSGKSTLMNILGCLDVPTSGEYLLNGHEVECLDEEELAQIRNREIGFVFQQFQLLPRLTAVQNVELPLIYSGVGEKERRELATEMLEKVGLGSKMNHRPTQLSGGQQQRVAIARALITKPTIILADEPTGALDQKTGTQIMNLFKKLHEEGRTIVMITHDEKIAQHGSRIIRILDGRLNEQQKTNNSDSTLEGDVKEHSLMKTDNTQMTTLNNDSSPQVKSMMNISDDTLGKLLHAFIMIAQDENLSETAGEFMKQFGTKLRENNIGGESDV